MEPPHLARRSGQAAWCDAAPWSSGGPPADLADAAATQAALCCQRPCTSTPRAAGVEGSTLGPSPASPSPSPQDSVVQPDPFPPGPLSSGGHPTAELAERRVCDCCSQELETSFTYVDENVNLEQRDRSSPSAKGSSHLGWGSPSEWPHEAAVSLVSDDEEEDTSSEATSSGRSIDYGFISAILCLVTGILLVIVSYIVPREVSVDPGSVAAREMERLEEESARLGAHLDRCVIAGLCLLTLGGVVLSCLLMMSMWKGELYRRHRFASSKESAKLYGSFSFRVKTSCHDNALELSLVEEDALAVPS